MGVLNAWDIFQLESHLKDEANSVITVGSAISLSNLDTGNWKLCIYVGQMKLLEIFEKGKGINKSNFNLIEDNIFEEGTLSKAAEDVSVTLAELRHDQNGDNIEFHALTYNIYQLSARENVKPLVILNILKFNLAQLETCDEGDIIQFERSIYHHSAILTDVSRMIITHRHGEPVDPTSLEGAVKSMSGFSIDKAQVNEDYIMDIAGTSRFMKSNETYDKCFLPRPKEEILREAKARIGETGYSITSNNCQHFVSECRNGNSYSHEAELVKQGAAVAAIAGVALVGAAFAKMIWSLATSTSSSDTSTSKKESKGQLKKIEQ